MSKVLTEEEFADIESLFEINLFIINKYTVLAGLEMAGETDTELYKAHKRELNPAIEKQFKLMEQFLNNDAKVFSIVGYLADYYQIKMSENAIMSAVDDRSPERRAATRMIAFFNQKNNAVMREQIFDLVVKDKKNIYGSLKNINRNSLEIRANVDKIARNSQMGVAVEQDFLAIFIKLLNKELVRPQIVGSQRILDREALIGLKYDLCSYDIDLERCFCESPTAEFEGRYDHSERLNEELNFPEYEILSIINLINQLRYMQAVGPLFINEPLLNSYKVMELILRASFVSINENVLSELNYNYHAETDNYYSTSSRSSTDPSDNTIISAFKNIKKDKSIIAEAKKQAKLKKE